MNKYFVLVLNVTACIFIMANISAQSLYSDSSYSSLIGDHKARKVGDSLTVLIFEQASAETSSGTDANKSLNASATATVNSDNNKASLGLSNEFDGGSNVARTGKLVASVSVSIKEILPSGEMVISGMQNIKFNDERQLISIYGKVRPVDISSSNTIISSRISDANITYEGDGLLGDYEKPGIITKLLNWLF